MSKSLVLAVLFLAVGCTQGTEERWKTMESLDRVVARVGHMVERGLADFEEHPVETGVKGVVMFCILRVVWRRL